MANGVVLQIRITERYDIGTDTFSLLLALLIMFYLNTVFTYCSVALVRDKAIPGSLRYTFHPWK
jgi:hypothetical protein